MIKIVNGDLLEHKGIIAHQVNCMGVMGAGLAKKIKQKYPKVFSKYTEACYKKENLLGRAQLIQIEDEVYVANIFGQYNYGRSRRQTDYQAVEKALKELGKKAIRRGNIEIGIPYLIGCGLAGGDWKVVSEIIAKTLENNKVIIYKLGA